MRTIAIHTSKGGVGKTTLTVNIAYELAKLGNKVLVIDLDDQANSSLYLGVNRADELNKATSIEEFNQILDSFKDREEIIDFLGKDFNSQNTDYRQCIKKNSLFNQYLVKSSSSGVIDVLPSSYRTRDDNLPSFFGSRDTLLKKALQKFGLDREYDYIVIDTPPSSTTVANNGLNASKYIIIPAQMEYFSVYGIGSVTRRIINGVQEDTNGEFGKILGIVPMMTSGNNINKFAIELVQKRFSNINILPELSRRISWADACNESLPISVFAKKKRSSAASEAAIQLANLTQKILEYIDQSENKKGE